MAAVFKLERKFPVQIASKGIPMKSFHFWHLYSMLLILGFVLLSSVLDLPAADNSPLPAPPVAKKEPKITEINGRKLVDNYYWLRDKKNPDVRAYLEAENAYTDAVMKPTEPLQKKLYDEMLGRVKETDVEVPYKDGGYFYYSRTEAGKQYPIRCRKKGSLDAPEEVLLDVNELAKGQAFMSLAAFDVSDDGNLLAYTTDNTGFRQYTLAVKDLRTGKMLVDHVERVDSVDWANDNKTIFYTVEDEVSKRSNQMFRHTVGTSGADTLVYEEKDERFGIYTGKTRSKAFLLLVSGSHTTSEARYIPADQPMAEWKLMEPRKQDVQYYPDHNGNFFYIRVNDTGRNFRLVKAPIADPGSKNWQEVVPQRADVMLDDTDFFKNYFISREREKGLPQIRVTDLQTGKSRRIEFPEPAYVCFPYANLEYDTTKFRYSYQSFITPQSIFEYDMPNGTSTLLKQQEVPGGYDRTRYQVEQIYATASDGVKIPISVVRLKSASLDGKGPIYLTGYGSYGVSSDIRFNSNIFSMVDRGVVVAVAHMRGGGEMGKAWHDDGRMMHKKNTFTDFISSAEFLVAQGYGSKDRLVIEGRSAGGLLMGAVLNMRPDLFHAALVGVPFVDVMNTMLDESLPLTVGEFEEWGNPKEKPAFDYMLTYSPYDNIEAKAYPNMLVRTSFNDSQVMYWEPAKYVAKMRALRTDHNTLILKTNMSPAGHGGASGRYDRLHETAFDYAYFLTQMGINN
ncbi:MAG TPA: S9 family peptidase [Candidatus Acidoferrales bacterium]|jgi:oligopeptidase B|nr:S9 family peptidase [Candidatus Acidoferrales bacterium]